MNDSELIWESYASQLKTRKVGQNFYSRNITFANGFEASVVSKKGMSYGGDEGLFEIALFDSEGNDVDIETGEPAGTMGNSNVGHLDFDQVVEVLDRIKLLRNRNRVIDIESEVRPRESGRLGF